MRIEHVAAVYRGVNELESSAFPSLHHRKEGWPQRLRRCREASADREAGVVFRLRTQRRTTPAASTSVASRYSLDDAPTPPCGDARRGITRRHNSFTSLYTAATVLTG